MKEEFGAQRPPQRNLSKNSRKGFLECYLLSISLSCFGLATLSAGAFIASYPFRIAWRQPSWSECSLAPGLRIWPREFSRAQRGRFCGVIFCFLRPRLVASYG